MHLGKITIRNSSVAVVHFTLVSPATSWIEPKFNKKETLRCGPNSEKSFRRNYDSSTALVNFCESSYIALIE